MNLNYTPGVLFGGDFLITSVWVLFGWGYLRLTAVQQYDIFVNPFLTYSTSFAPYSKIDSATDLKPFSLVDR